MTTKLQVLWGATDFHRKFHKNRQNDLMLCLYCFFPTCPKRLQTCLSQPAHNTSTYHRAILTASLLSNLKRLIIIAWEHFTPVRVKRCHFKIERYLQVNIVVDHSYILFVVFKITLANTRAKRKCFDSRRRTISNATPPVSQSVNQIKKKHSACVSTHNTSC